MSIGSKIKQLRTFYGLTQEELAKRLGKSRSHITNMLGLLNLPEEVKEAITHDKKASDQNCSVVYVSELGNGSIEEWSMDEVLGRLECNEDEEYIW